MLCALLFKVVSKHLKPPGLVVCLAMGADLTLSFTEGVVEKILPPSDSEEDEEEEEKETMESEGKLLVFINVCLL